MAKIVVLSMAYRGDVHPYVPIASELARRGHDVTFVVPREFHDEFATEPFCSVHSGSDFGPTELNKHGKWLARWGMRFGGIRLLELYIGKFTVWHARRQELLGTGIHAPQGKHLAQALARLVDAPAYAARSAPFAALLATEDGVTTSAQRTEAFLAGADVTR